MRFGMVDSQSNLDKFVLRTSDWCAVFGWHLLCWIGPQCPTHTLGQTVPLILPISCSILLKCFTISWCLKYFFHSSMAKQKKSTTQFAYIGKQRFISYIPHTKGVLSLMVSLKIFGKKIQQWPLNFLTHLSDQPFWIVSTNHNSQWNQYFM